MTLTAIVPTLRRSIPDPFHPSAWPEHTQTTTTDVVIAGVSLRRLVELCETPCVHSADALVPGSRLRPELRRDASVVMTTVTGTCTDDVGEWVVRIDADLMAAPVLWEETRLIGRVSTAPLRRAVIGGAGCAWVPGDATEGDLLAIPCRELVTLHDIRPRTPEALVDPAARASTGTLA
ncbi:hypothetical protein [Microbacterium sp. RU33B]|uniref:hypothetical protein n=1 Tax=Microbacterium sp. RU33B TaxID=1907390 RepID=UPI00095EC25F|nr:hypothetical protein [Microbacterium sp. RU33B]SIT66671.1 hypothetical protein SAMN05880545_0035 [Microbacterium sp. RU33B]